MVAPDPVDVQLLTVVAESGRTAIPELAHRLGMDVRDVAARLAALSTTGLPLIVGVECEPQGIRNAVAAANAWSAQAAGYPGPNPAAVGYPAPPANSGSYPTPGQYPAQSGPYPAQSGPYPAQSGAFPAQSGPYPAQSGPLPGRPVASGPHQPQPPVPPHAAAPPQQVSRQPNPTSTWGPPGSAAWAGAPAAGQPGQMSPTGTSPAQRVGTVGSTLETQTFEGENVSIQLVEVVDPADFLFTAAGYELGEGQRSVIVHTELTNQGSAPFNTLPDWSLVLVTTDGSTVSKSQATLSSRPAHRPGIGPGETAGGHTVYVLPESISLTAVRWSPRPGDMQRALSWDISDL